MTLTLVLFLLGTTPIYANDNVPEEVQKAQQSVVHAALLKRSRNRPGMGSYIQIDSRYALAFPTLSAFTAVGSAPGFMGEQSQELPLALLRNDKVFRSTTTFHEPRFEHTEDYGSFYAHVTRPGHLLANILPDFFADKFLKHQGAIDWFPAPTLLSVAGAPLPPLKKKEPFGKNIHAKPKEKVYALDLIANSIVPGHVATTPITKTVNEGETMIVERLQGSSKMAIHSSAGAALYSLLRSYNFNQDVLPGTPIVRADGTLDGIATNSALSPKNTQYPANIIGVCPSIYDHLLRK